MNFTTLVLNNSAYIVAGIFAGLISGLMGLGGGIVVVPLLIFIFRHQADFPQDIMMQMAAGTSLAVMIFTACASIFTHYKQNNILWSLYNRLWPGLVAGTIGGTFLAFKLPTYGLRLLFGLFLLFIALKMLIEIHKKSVKKPRSFPSNRINAIINFFIGSLSGLFGIGGGALIIPYLNYYQVNIKKIIPISALCTMAIAITGTIACIITGSMSQKLPAHSLGFIYWPAVLGIGIFSSFFAPLGARLTYTLPVKQLQYIFISLLIFTAINLLILKGLF